MVKIGVQAMMLRDSIAEIGVVETLRKVREIGYGAIEVSQIKMTPENVADCKRLGTSMVRIGMLQFEFMTDLGKVLEFCDRVEAVALQLQENGIRLYHHNHHIEYRKFAGVPILDVIADRAPDVGLELDVHWLQRGGMNPVAVIEQYAGRVRMVHLKDYRIGEISPAVVEAQRSGDRGAFMREFTDVVEFAEVGEGNLDFQAIVPAAIASGAEFLLVEQDLFYGRTVWEVLQTSHDNLVAMGFADLF